MLRHLDCGSVVFLPGEADVPKPDKMAAERNCRSMMLVLYCENDVLIGDDWSERCLGANAIEDRMSGVVMLYVFRLPSQDTHRTSARLYRRPSGNLLPITGIYSCVVRMHE